MKALRKGYTMLLTAVGLTMVLAVPSWAEDKKGSTAAIVDGKQVSLEYTLTLEDKSTIDSNVGKDPLVFTQGAHEIIPGLEKKLSGLKVGESKKIEVSPEEGYGPVDPQRRQEVEKMKIPEDARKIGAKLTGQGPDGRMVFAQVTDIKGDTVILDLNHPLAGKKLFFDVKVLKVEDAPEKLEGMSEAPAASAAPAAKPAK
ncbi:MAG: peptidylprolyl isomerase [Candidatus Binatia bacterium]